ncbi:MAG: ExbD/TolR family protein [Opitutales bacterium]
MSQRRAINAEDEQTEINLSPMIDCIFILLIFFIVTTVFVEKPEVEIIKPPSVVTERLAKNSIILAITKDNKIFYGSKEMSVAGAGAQVRQLLVENRDYPVIIQGDIRGDTGILRRLHREVKNAGAKQIFFSTRE